jgi:hypothetical protein
MRIHSPYVTGSLIVSGSVTIITPPGTTANVNALSASLAQTASYISPTFISASAAASGFGSGGGPESDPIFAAWSASAASKFAGTSSLALTASVLLGLATSASFASTASYLNQLNQNLTIVGNLNVFGTASYTLVSASQLDVGTNTISVNVAEPAERFGGLIVYDSGSLSHQATASLFWDSLHNHWVYQNASGSTYSGGMLMSGPRNTGSLGDEPGLTKWFITRGDGGDHLNDTQIFSSASIHIVTGSLFVSSSNNTQLQVGNGLLFVSSSGNVGIGTTTPATALEVSGVIRTSQMSIGGLDSGRNQFLTYTNGPVYRMFAGSVYASLGVGSLSVGSTYGAISGSANTVLIEGNTSIGTTSASLARLQIQGSGATSVTTALRIENSNTSPLLVVRNNTSVGIGTATPSAPLEVVGNTIISGTITQQATNGILLYDSTGYGGGKIHGSFNFINGEVYITPAGSPNQNFVFSPNSGMSIGGFTIGGTAGSPPAYGLAVSGSVGIGTRTPISQLDVSGSGRFTNELVVTGSLIAPTITGSLQGSASYALTASYALNGGGGGGGGGTVSLIVAGPGISVQDGSGPTVTINATQQTNLGLTYAIAMGYLMP